VSDDANKIDLPKRGFGKIHSSAKRWEYGGFHSYETTPEIIAIESQDRSWSATYHRTDGDHTRELIPRTSFFIPTGAGQGDSVPVVDQWTLNKMSQFLVVHRRHHGMTKPTSFLTNYPYGTTFRPGTRESQYFRIGTDTTNPWGGAKRNEIRTKIRSLFLQHTTKTSQTFSNL
jgi:hypothetical protein